MNNNPIGIFDSGVGGLTVVKEVIKTLPNESLIYVGDTARVPYGTRGKETITEFALEIVRFLLKQNVKMIVVACNTISATCLDVIQENSPVPVIGVIIPASKEAVNSTKLKTIGVIGTPATINSEAYKKEISRLRNNVEVVQQACPLLVPLIEEGMINKEATKIIVKDYLENLKNTEMDTLILGCTHYPILRETIRDVVGKEINLIDSAKPTALELKELLESKDLRSNQEVGEYTFYVTDAPERAQKIAEVLFEGEFPGELKLTSL